ncbi:hypothetical protein BJF79_38990 [Actinomadura sp. CNU-125]|nr:hypothetical protein BJF79_38990 [Actinomadura sp. CNU-125]
MLGIVAADGLHDRLPEHPPGEPVAAQDVFERLPLPGAALAEPARPVEVGAAAGRLQDRLEAVPEAGVAHLPHVAEHRLGTVAAVLAREDLAGEPVGEFGKPVLQAENRLAQDRAVGVTRHGGHLQGRTGASWSHPPRARDHKRERGLCHCTMRRFQDCTRAL